MDVLFSLMLGWINVGISAALILALLILLRPVLMRVLSAQQRVVVWMFTCFGGYYVGAAMPAALPVTFLDLFASRTGVGGTGTVAAFLPASYTGDGTYLLALPGGATVPIQLRDWMMWGLLLLWLAVMAFIIVGCVRHSRELDQVTDGREKLRPHDPRMAGADFGAADGNVYVCPGLPTSYVRYRSGDLDDIVIQAELPPEQFDLVLLHETRHLALWHVWWKVLAFATAVLCWWDPLVWVGLGLFCEDLELACDDSVMKRLDPAQRKRYAKTLVELGSGRQMWEVPLAFGECGGARRVERLTRWKRRPWWVQALTWGLAVLLILFLWGVHPIG